MLKQKYNHPNHLILYRQRMAFTQTQVAQLLGHRDSKRISNLELGRRLPSLQTSLRLAIIYRVPVDFLYPEMYSAQREQIRAREQSLKLGQQGTLFEGDR
jgi:transcriptional regulator with XRE-family HTH domain